MTLYVGVDLGGTNIKAGIVDLDAGPDRVPGTLFPLSHLTKFHLQPFSPGEGHAEGWLNHDRGILQTLTAVRLAG